jgi:hypothetical protein
MKYREATKWVMWSEVQTRYSPAIGKKKRAKRMKAFLFPFEKKAKRTNRMIEIIMRGARGTQSWSRL